LLPTLRVLVLDPPSSPLSPYTTLFRSYSLGASSVSSAAPTPNPLFKSLGRSDAIPRPPSCASGDSLAASIGVHTPPTSSRSGPRDRKSTRLNSSHGSISYAVFCLKKKE